MKCPYCGSEETDVLETRDGEESTRRRRECQKCTKRFTTYERVENVDLVILKKDGRREKFDREKLRRGIVKATEKRPISTELIGSIVAEIEQELRNRDGVEVSSKTIGNLVLKKLKKIDKVAYVRFASVYLDFGDLADFEKVIEKLT
ncbi:transcriptional regulator NrdR [Candidatus Gottesmanbacteria bacterium RIFCSPHIGHO2_01_FULL_47_48]|uniref:Transcriptional repressor NrdR n=1 Tax=Candidatus Gottesmanbacteria bacterium RIFCSPHIGHO2_01_FULL_47_48 TaxID=1798381 RepID=A0A1F6A1F8_9BACT|nr:MAG: transcriptional regulator NrdR [Candidatus Gottesmanbacteria bacterium RIFCSPHIGHO2_01_FULL_47_48]